jgi:hypothetical protein
MATECTVCLTITENDVRTKHTITSSVERTKILQQIVTWSALAARVPQET